LSPSLFLFNSFNAEALAHAISLLACNAKSFHVSEFNSLPNVRGTCGGVIEIHITPSVETLKKGMQEIHII